jgi:geranylgeranyl diphosphate synthase type II
LHFCDRLVHRAEELLLELMTPAELDAYLAECRQLTLGEIKAIIPSERRYQSVLYELMLEYPLRAAKALRPALCIATCRALGGRLESVLHSAAVLELYHNAFLIHDDVEDGSESRRDCPTLHRSYGTPIAVNVGDAMLALALQPLLDNMRLLGMGKALRILQTVARMARESTEGQAIELDWIRNHLWSLNDTDYVRMVYKKTSWYTFIAPMIIGATVAGVPADVLTRIRKFAALLGVAFQIQDDVLNLVGDDRAYGKEAAGDLWEGKRTLIVLHMMRTASASERQLASAILRKPRPRSDAPHASELHTLLSALHADGALSTTARQQIATALERLAPGSNGTAKTHDDISYLLSLVDRHGSIEYARRVAQRFAQKAEILLSHATWIGPSVHRDFLQALVDFVVTRNR